MLTDAARCGTVARKGALCADADRPSGVGVNAASMSWFDVAIAELSFWKMASMSSIVAGAVAGRSIRNPGFGSRADVPYPAASMAAMRQQLCKTLCPTLVPPPAPALRHFSSAYPCKGPAAAAASWLLAVGPASQNPLSF
eukprot:scaffold473_cov104-Isochrysis_galbana.AAC.4